MRFARKFVKLMVLILTSAFVVAGAAAGCSGGYGDPSGPDTAQVR